MKHGANCGDQPQESKEPQASCHMDGGHREKYMDLNVESLDF